MPSLKDLLEAMSASWPVALAALLASCGVLAGYHFELDYLRALPAWLPGVAFIAATLAASVLGITVVRFLIDAALNPGRKRRAEQWRQKHIEELDDLPEAELLLLAWALANKTRVFSAPYFNQHTKALSAKGFLIVPGGNHHTDETPFEIPNYVWDALKEKLKSQDIRQLVGLQPFQNQWH